MDTQAWIYVPDVDDDRPWTGRIWNDGDEEIRLRFEMIRHAEIQQIYDVSPFSGARPVSGLLDHQRPCTIIRPIVTKIDPGKFGEKHPFLRTRIEGTCQALLTGLAIADETEETIEGIGFESDAFAAWYGGRSFSTVKSEDSRTEQIETSSAVKETVVVAGLGTVEATRIASVNEDHRSSVVRTRTFLRISFEQARSLNKSIDLCVGLELLFGFLAGFRPRPPTFHLWQSPVSQEGKTLRREAELQIGGVNWLAAETPHPMHRIHMAGQSQLGLQGILDAFIARPVDFATRIHFIESSRYFSTTLNDKFAQVMPVFEEYLKGNFNHADEDSYAAKEKAFFNWVDQSSDTEIVEFSKKHLKLVERKAPSLPTLIERSIDSLNSAGFRFSRDLAKLVSSRRAAMFHSTPLMEEHDVRSFYFEVRAVTAMLLLHTLQDLGVPLRPLSEAYGALSDFMQFLKKGPWKEEAES